MDTGNCRTLHLDSATEASGGRRQKSRMVFLKGRSNFQRKAIASFDSLNDTLPEKANDRTAKPIQRGWWSQRTGLVRAKIRLGAFCEGCSRR